MGRFDDEPQPTPEAKGALLLLAQVTPQVEPRPTKHTLQTVIEVILSVPHPSGMRPRDVRDSVRVRLKAMGWWTRTRYKVASRGTPDGYKGVLDLVTHPAPERGAQQLPDPVLVEFDAVSVERRTLAKLASYDGRTAGVLIVLTGTSRHDPIQGVDAILCLG